jgi:myosin heavy subunit
VSGQNTVIVTGTLDSGKTTILSQLLGRLVKPENLESTTMSEKRLWETIVLMEAFGNARTANPDLSRMGKLLEASLATGP